MKNEYVFIIVGAGGTGTYFLKEFSRFIAGTNYEKKIAGMYILDGDCVEKKNLTRQCFIEEDIGRNKAAVMAEILNDSFRLSYVSLNMYLTQKKTLKEIVNGHLSYDIKTIPVIISCVDNHGCRLLLEDYFNDSKDCIYFDAANEYETGEVVYSYKVDSKVVGPLRSFYFPGIKHQDTRSREEMSCEELNNVSPQHIFTNMKSAHLLLCGVTNLFSGTLTPGFSYFNVFKYESGFVPAKGGVRNG